MQTVINLRPDGDGLLRPLIFFLFVRKRCGLSPPHFFHIISVPFYTMRIIFKFVWVRSGHQGRSSDLTFEKVCSYITSTVFKRRGRHFQDFIRASVLIKGTSRNFNIGDLESGLFCRFAISQREKIERCLFWTETILHILKHLFTCKLDTRIEKS